MIQVPTDFQCFQLTPEEIVAAKKWTTIQHAFLTNLQGEIAHQKINLKVVPSELSDFIQQEAYLTGQLDLIRTLLTPIEAPNNLTETEE